tara:strand:+ start:713 stop:850 length:138 start_codon:yes stop_codon:yes gene_type:complete
MLTRAGGLYSYNEEHPLRKIILLKIPRAKQVKRFLFNKSENLAMN